MEQIRNKSGLMSIILRILTLGMLIIHFLVLTTEASAQALKSGANFQSESPFSSVNAQRIKVRNIYTSQIGVREKNSNSGPEVERYLRYVNLSKGNPWCAAFVCWVYGEAGVGNPRSGWSPALFVEGRVIWASGEPRAKSQEPRHLQSVPSAYTSRPATGNWQLSDGNIMRPARQLTMGNWQPTKSNNRSSFSNFKFPIPMTGDVFGLYFPEKARIAHVGFIDEWKDPWVVTVEGNTNVLGSREGDGVYRKRRLVRSLFRVARYVE